MPSALVVKKGVNSSAATASLMPLPESATLNSTDDTKPSAVTGSARACSRSTRAPGTSSIACRPLRARLSSTCSIMVGSHHTAGNSGGTSSCTVAPSLRACNCTSGSTVSNSARGVTASRAVLRWRTRSRTL